MKKIISSVWLLGLLLALPVIFFIQPEFNKFKIVPVKTDPRNESTLRTYFADLDNDGKKEKVYGIKNGSDQLAFQYYKLAGKMGNQVNFSHNFSPQVKELFFGDANRNGRAEIYGFSMQDDSLFLNWAELLNDSLIKKSDRFICTIGKFNQGAMNFGIPDFAVTDLENDGTCEIIFSVEAGYSLTPRKIFKYIPDYNQLTSSVDDGINMSNFVFEDLDNDGKKEIITSSSSSANHKGTWGQDTIDTRPFLKVFRSNLDTFFIPVPFEEGLVNQICTFVAGKGKKSLTVFHFFKGTADDIPIKIYSFSTTGQKLDSLLIPDEGDLFNPLVLREPDDHFILLADSKIHWIGPDLKLINTRKFDFVFSMVKKVNLPGDSESQFLARDINGQDLYVFDERFRHPARYHFTSSISSVTTGTDMGNEYFIVTSGNSDLYFKYSRNALYLIKFPVILLVYLFSAGFLRVIQKIAEKRIRERFELQNQLREFQFKSLSNQIDPHFMFNSFNTMAALLKKGDQENAYDAFMKFTRLVRANLENSEMLTRQLSDEIQVVTQYLDLNKLRFREKLRYEIEVGKEVDQTLFVPKMLVQIHVENALKHGLSPKKEDWMIKIGITGTGETINISVEDNGIGRQKAKELNRPSTGKGLKMLQAVYDRLNEKNRLKITQNIVDLFNDQGEPAGTRVEIEVPATLKE